MKKLMKNIAGLILLLIVSASSCTEFGSSSGNSVTPPVTQQTEVLDDLVEIEELVEVEEEALFYSINEEGPAQFNTEEYTYFKENNFKTAWGEPLSTFSIDVDNASYSNVRRMIEDNYLPPVDAVRIEEMVNYFAYDYAEPEGIHPFSVVTELGKCPWKQENYLLHVGIQGKSLDYEDIRPGNYVFLVDVSGSMESPFKLTLVKSSLKLMLKNLDKQDRVSLVVYAGQAGLVLPSTPVSERNKILRAIDQLEAGGSTAGGEGILLAYRQAEKNLIPGGNNRVILTTDGDFNVGVSSTGDLVRLIEEKRKSGIYLTICGFGMGNYKDSRMEEISNAGNGNYFYIDNAREADKVFSRELRANLFTIAKDVKIQIEFNPKYVKAYRLIGYENRLMDNKDFEDDTKDAGELGAGHTVTALYEIIPETESNRTSKDLKFQKRVLETKSELLADLKLRYKPIDSETSVLIQREVGSNPQSSTTENFKFSAAVAGFGMLLRRSEHSGDFNYEDVRALASGSASMNDYDRQEFIQLVKSAEILKNN